MNDSTLSQKNQSIKGIMISSQHDEKVVFLASVPLNLLPTLPHTPANRTQKTLTEILELLSPYISSIHSDLAQLQNEYDWDAYLSPILKRIHIQVKILEGKLKKAISKEF